MPETADGEETEMKPEDMAQEQIEQAKACRTKEDKRRCKNCHKEEWRRTK